MIDTDDLRRRADLVAIVRGYGVQLTQKGKRHEGLCPLHDDSTSSFSVYEKAGIQRCGCFACRFDDDVIDFVKRMENLPDFKTAADRVQEIVGGSPVTSNSNGNGHHSMPLKTAKSKLGKTLATYPYVDAEGRLLFEVLRKEVLDADGNPIEGKKTFIQRRPDGKGGWAWDLKGVRRELYRLPAVLKAETVWIVEGEKDVHTLESLGVTATTAPGGASAPWQPQYTDALRGKHVFLVPDTDKPGQEYGQRVAAAIAGAAASAKIVPLPYADMGVKDVTDYMAGGSSIGDLIALAEPYQAPAAAQEPRVSTAEIDWRQLLLVNREMQPKASIANVLSALRHAPEWQGVLYYNEFSLATHARGNFPGRNDGSTAEIVWTDNHDVITTYWMHHNGIYCSPETVGKAVESIAREHSFHPVREYLDRLQWDGERRIDGWLREYLGAESSNYVCAVGAAWLISAIARIYQPGCKADCCIILEGDQGIKKSTALRILGGDWFADEIADLGSKDAALGTSGVWILEMSELDSFQRSEVGRLKAFMSRACDHFRPPYGKRAIDVPRQCIFAGSTNQETYFKDESGNRRFWPIRCGVSGPIDTDRLQADRDQIWAEACARYRDGEVWWLDDPAIIREAEAQQRARYEGDPWDERIRTWLESRNETSIAQILDQCIVKPTKDWNQLDKNRIGRVLRAQKWVPYLGQVEPGSDQRERRFRRPGGLEIL